MGQKSGNYSPSFPICPLMKLQVWDDSRLTRCLIWGLKKQDLGTGSELQVEVPDLS